MSTTAVPRSATYLGADRSGAEFWLSGPHIFYLPGFADGAPGHLQGHTHHVCALARFNRRSRSRGGCKNPAAAHRSVRRFSP